MKTNKILYSIFEQCTGKIPSGDARLKERFILHQMNSVRAVLIKNAYLEGSLNESFYQMKCCIEIECDRITCSGFDSGEKVFYAILPELVEGIGFSNITYFGNVEFAKIYKGLHNNWDRKTMGGYLSMEYNRWTSKRPGYTIIGGYKAGDTEVDSNVALLKNLPNNGGKFLCVNGIFANPEEGVCDDDDIMEMEYPLPANMVHKLELIVIKQILSTEGVPGDDVNNARDNTSDVVQPQKQQPIDPERYEQ